MANTFLYKCKECGQTYKKWGYSLWDEDGNKVTVDCPRCGTANISHGSAPDGDKIRYSRNLGFSPDQLRNPNERAIIEKAHPGAEFNASGHMKISNRTEKLRRIKERSSMTKQNLVEGD